MDLEEKEIQEAERKKRRAELLGDLKEIASTPQGRRFLWRFFGEARIFGFCYDSGATVNTFYNEGRREFALRTFRDLMEVAPELFTKMQTEMGTPANG